ncbi:hypothetical protein RPMA_08235 [Tardiphaga alba]|uniref:Uncharacterized protein n=1 Tax=Tardiphaga alba TaxID=340268 RepID=A0ABX8A5X0_9BRAD|nr:hypothetical protein RPMA_08235 [Tardiphaga alba]
MEGEAHAGGRGLPVIALAAGDTLHQPPPEKCDPNEPKPLRATWVPLDDVPATLVPEEVLLPVKFARDDDELLPLLL